MGRPEKGRAGEGGWEAGASEVLGNRARRDAQLFHLQVTVTGTKHPGASHPPGSSGVLPHSLKVRTPGPPLPTRLPRSPTHLPAPPRCSLPPRLLPDFVQNKRGCRPIRSAQSHPTPQARGCSEWRRDPCGAASPSGWRSQSYIPPEPPSLVPFARWGLQNKPPNLWSGGVRQGGEWDEKGLYRCLTRPKWGSEIIYYYH